MRFMQTDRASLNKSNKNPYTLITLYLATIQDIGRRLVDLKHDTTTFPFSWLSMSYQIHSGSSFYFYITSTGKLYLSLTKMIRHLTCSKTKLWCYVLLMVLRVAHLVLVVAFLLRIECALDVNRAFLT